MISAEGFSAADLRHGPIAIVEQGTPVLAFLADGPAHADMADLVADLRGRGARRLRRRPGAGRRPAAPGGRAGGADADRRRRARPAGRARAGPPARAGPGRPGRAEQGDRDVAVVPCRRRGEIASQPACWRRRAPRWPRRLSPRCRGAASASRSLGCGTSLFMAQAYARAARGGRPRRDRRVRGLRVPARPRATTASSRSRRSGTTTEVLDAARGAASQRDRRDHGDADAPLAALTDACDRARLRRRAVGRPDALRHHGARPAARAPSART